nr:GGGtGRT protein [Clostridium pasteurianum]
MQVSRIKTEKCVEMMGLIGMGNNPMVGATVAVAVAIEETSR